MKNIILITGLAICAVSCKKTEPATTQAAEQVIPYPLDTCIVSDKKLGSMGDPVVIVHQGQEVRFCCDHCVPTFQKDPQKFLSKLKQP